MFLAAALALWTALPALLGWYLHWRGRPALALTALAVAFMLAAASLGQFMSLPDAQETSTFRDTYFQTSRFHYQISMALLYLAVSALCALALRIAKGLLRQVMTAAFWGFHLGTGPLIVPTLQPASLMPRRYVNYPDAFYWQNLSASVGAPLATVSLALLVLLILLALGQFLLRRRKHAL